VELPDDLLIDSGFFNLDDLRNSSLLFIKYYRNYFYRLQNIPINTFRQLKNQQMSATVSPEATPVS
jgi:hypothetical protein